MKLVVRGDNPKKMDILRICDGEIEKVFDYADNMPERPEEIEGKQIVLYYNSENNVLFYDYVDIELTSEQQIQEDLKELQSVVGELILGGE